MPIVTSFWQPEKPPGRGLSQFSRAPRQSRGRRKWDCPLRRWEDSFDTKVLKKGTGSEPIEANPRKNGGCEVPVPLFQRAARFGEPLQISNRSAILTDVSAVAIVAFEAIGAWRSLASASEWGSEGRKFKSCRPDFFGGDKFRNWTYPLFLPRVDFHGSKEVPTGTCRAILKAAGLK